jgi:autotransporter-associated beta strand protein
VDALRAGLIVGDIDTATEMVVVDNSHQIADFVPVTVNGSGVLFLVNNNESIGALTVTNGTVANSGGTASSSLTVSSLTMTGGNVGMGGGFLILNGNVTTNASATTPVIDGNVTWSGSRTFTVADGTAFDDLAIFATVSGGPGVGIIKAGPGRMALQGTNTNEGNTTVSAGTLVLQNASALGDTVNGSTTVDDGATLELRNITGSYAPEFLVLNGAGAGGVGALFNQFGNNVWTGTINMGAAVQIGASGGTTLDIASSIITGGTLTKVGLAR